MNRICTAILIAVLAVGCATAGPIAIKCGLQDVQIAAADYAQIKADIQTKNWQDLVKEAEKIGWATVDCVLGAQARQSPELKPNVDEFRRLHAVELRNAE